jgi:hypothetical protein
VSLLPNAGSMCGTLPAITWSSSSHYTMAIAAYRAAVEARPRDKITLRQGARVVVKNWKE